MFQFPSFPSLNYVFIKWSHILHMSGFPIRKSADRSLFAAPRSLSQLVTSFVGSWCQGIHLVLFIAWTSLFAIFCLSFANNLLQWKSFFLTTLQSVNISFSLAKCDLMNRKKYSDAVLTVFQVRTHSCTVLCFFVSWFACSFEHAAKL